jgi:DNA-directed RNA polymerase specialized sigma24 family protein
MSESEVDLGELVRQAQAGSAEAAQALHDRLRPILLGVIRRKMGYFPRSAFDSEDVLQLVMKSIFMGDHAGVIPEDARGWERYFARMTTYKTYNQIRKYCAAQCRTVRRETPLEDVQAGRPEVLFSRDPSPSKTLGHHEQLERFLAGQPRLYRRALVLLYDGNRPREVAQLLQVPEQLVKRLQTKLRQALQET